MVYATDRCAECKRVHRDNSITTTTVPYVFVGHHPSTPTMLMSTWFHYIVDLQKQERGFLFDADLTVFGFLRLQQNILRFDNQLHISHWNLVLRSPYRFMNDTQTVFKILDHELLMCDIPVGMLKDLQIHAVSVYDTRMRYLPTLVTPQNKLYLTAFARANVEEICPLHFAWRPFDQTAYSNEQHYLKQENGHGLFQNDSTIPYDRERGMLSTRHFEYVSKRLKNRRAFSTTRGMMRTEVDQLVSQGSISLQFFV